MVEGKFIIPNLTPLEANKVLPLFNYMQENFAATLTLCRALVEAIERHHATNA